MTKKIVWPSRSEMAAFYGNPDANGDGLPDAAWERVNLVFIECPWTLTIEWAPASKTKRIRCHAKVAASLTRILGTIWELHGKDQARIEKQGMHLYSGCYNFRVQRGTKKPILSSHGYAAAVDFNATANPLGKRWKAGMMSLDVVRAFKDEGWSWGGDWQRTDAQHFEAVRP